MDLSHGVTGLPPSVLSQPIKTARKSLVEICVDLESGQEHTVENLFIHLNTVRNVLPSPELFPISAIIFDKIAILIDQCSCKDTKNALLYDLLDIELTWFNVDPVANLETIVSNQNMMEQARGYFRADGYTHMVANPSVRAIELGASPEKVQKLVRLISSLSQLDIVLRFPAMVSNIGDDTVATAWESSAEESWELNDPDVLELQKDSGL